MNTSFSEEERSRRPYSRRTICSTKRRYEPKARRSRRTDACATSGGVTTDSVWKAFGFGKPSMLFPKLPLQRTCIHRDERFQNAFSRDAMAILLSWHGLALQPTPEGLKLYGENEEVLDRAVAALRKAHHGHFFVSPVSVRYREGAAVEEPYMAVQVSCPSEHADKVYVDLARRGASALDVEKAFQRSTVRAVVPLRRLLGYAKNLTLITGGSATHAMWLAHYAPTDPVRALDDHSEEARSSSDGELDTDIHV